MGANHLAIYLDDHSALMAGESELAKRCCRSNRGTPLGEFLGRLAVEIDAQRSVVRGLLREVGGRGSMAKQGAAWIAEKVGRLKPNGSLLAYSPLSRVVELEALYAAATGRVSLWETLETLAESDERLSGITYGHFRERAESQLAELRSRTRFAAALAFRT